MTRWRDPMTLWARLALALMLACGLAGPAALADSLGVAAGGPNVAQSDDDDGGGGDDDDGGGGGDDDDGGGGDDDDGGGDDGGGDDDDGGDDGVAQVARYVVEVDCGFDGTAQRTDCTFAARAEGGAAAVGDLALPAEAVCTEVLGGNYETDFEADVLAGEAIAYSARAGEEALVLQFAGEVGVSGQTTYWVSTDAGLFPAQGPAIVCPTGETPFAIQVTRTPASATGTIEVVALGCDAARPADPAAFDWFGECGEQVTGTTFELTRLEADALVAVDSAETDDQGVARFEEVEPGTYDLVLAEGTWCHAESDSVNERGEVVVEADVQATVWTFHCADGATSDPTK